MLTLARLALLPLTALSPVEAHAALCSQQLDLWHPMTGPLLPLLMRLSSAVFGLNEFALRFPAPLLMLGAGWLVWKLALGLFDATTAAWAAVLFQVTPIVNVASVTFTHTTLAIAESAALLALLRLALHQPRRFHLHWWAVAGMTLLAFFTDWRLAVFAIAGTGSLLLTRRGRNALLKWPVLPILGGTLAVALLVFVVWNLGHHWAALRFPGAGLAAFRAIWHGALLGYGPPMILLLAWTLVDVTLQRPLTYAPAFLLAFAWPLITLDVLCLPTTPWPQAGFAAWFPPAVMLAAARLMQTERLALRVKVWIRSIAVLGAAIQSCVLLQPSLTRACGLTWGFDPPRHAGLLPGNPSRDLTGWAEAADQIRGTLSANQLDPSRCLFIAERWDLAAPLAFELRDLPPLPAAPSQPRVQALPDPTGSTSFPDATAIFITDDESRLLPPELIRQHWPHARVIAVFAITRDERTARVLKVFSCSSTPANEKSKGPE